MGSEMCIRDRHAPNEHMIESVVKSGLKLMAGIFWDLGEKGTPN